MCDFGYESVVAVVVEDGDDDEDDDVAGNLGDVEQYEEQMCHHHSLARVCSFEMDVSRWTPDDDENDESEDSASKQVEVVVVVGEFVEDD